MRRWRILLAIIAVVCIGVAVSYPIRYRLNQKSNNRTMEELAAMRARGLAQLQSASPVPAATDPTRTPEAVPGPENTPEPEATDGTVTPEPTNAPQATAAPDAAANPEATVPPEKPEEPKTTAQGDEPKTAVSPAKEADTEPTAQTVQNAGDDNSAQAEPAPEPTPDRKPPETPDAKDTPAPEATGSDNAPQPEAGNTPEQETGNTPEAEGAIAPESTPEAAGEPEPAKTPAPETAGEPEPAKTPAPEAAGETPQPQRTPEPAETPNPEKTAAPDAAETPGPAETPLPVSAENPAGPSETENPPVTAETETPAETPAPGTTPEPTETEEPAEEPDATSAPEPEGTEGPAETSVPEITPGPEETEKPDQGPEPDETPNPEDTPRPEETPGPEETPNPEATPEGSPETIPEAAPNVLRYVLWDVEGVHPKGTPTPRPQITPAPTPIPLPTPDRTVREEALPYPLKEKVELDVDLILPELKEIYELNHDLVGWISIPRTVVDYPVVQREDSDFYLDHDFYGQENNNGQIILDAPCDPYTPSYNLVISGHSMKTGSMFGSLVAYRTREYWRLHKTVEFDSLMERKNYVIFAAFFSADYDVDEEGFRYNADIQYRLDAETWLADIAANQVYDTGIDAEFGDEFLTLTTCSSLYQKNGRFVVVCRRIREGESFD